MKREDEDPWERYKRRMDDWPFGIIDGIFEDIGDWLKNFGKPQYLIPLVAVVVLSIIGINIHPPVPAHFDWDWILWPFSLLWN